MVRTKFMPSGGNTVAHMISQANYWKTKDVHNMKNASAPAQVLRCEGMMLLAAETGLLAADRQQQEMAKQYQHVNGQTLEQDWGDRWSDFFEFPQIPAFAPRAPVVPSTRELD